jgi:murein tripeptide amidase MpaA
MGINVRIFFTCCKQQRSSNFFDSYATYDQMQQFLQQLASNYSSLTTLVNVGTSLENREITGIVIQGSTGKPSIVMNALQHAR